MLDGCVARTQSPRSQAAPPPRSRSRGTMYKNRNNTNAISGCKQSDMSTAVSCNEIVSHITSWMSVGADDMAITVPIAATVAH